MDTTTAQRIAKRFVSLPLEQRRQILDTMIGSGQSFRLLPIVATRQDVPRIPLSYAQQRMLFLWQMEPDSDRYNVPMTVRLRGNVDENALRRALELLVERHETLRTRFATRDGEFYQEVSQASPVVLKIISSPAEHDEPTLQQHIQHELSRPFDLLDGPMLRVTLWRAGPGEQLLTLVMHHIVSDGWSSELMVEELVGAYGTFASGGQPAFAPLPIQYADYAIWQRAWLEAGEGTRQLAYWREQLGEEQPLLALPLDRERPPSPSYQGAVVHTDIPEALAERLRQLARQQGLSLFMLMLAAAAVVLSRYSGQADIRVGAPNAGRNRQELEGLIGFFINTQVLRVQVDERATFVELLDQVRTVVAGAQSHQDLPFEQLVDALVPERNLGHNPLFQFKLNQHLTVKATGSKHLGDLTVDALPSQGGSARFDLALDFTDTATGIEAMFTYATDLFDAASIERIAASLRTTLEAMTLAPTQRIFERPAAPAIVVEQQQDFASADFLSLWRGGLQWAGEGPALRCGEQVVSYPELELRSNRLAHYLKANGIVAGTTVALCQERSVDWVTCVLAVLKAGGVYLPLDSRQPLERLQRLLEGSGAALLIHDPHDGRFTGMESIRVLACDPEYWAGHSDRPVTVAIAPEQSAYVIYTSGSTGRPKGVVISHRALANYLQGVLVRLRLAPKCSMAMVSTVAADLGHTLLFGALASGRELHLLSHELAFDPDGFAAYMAEHQVGVLKVVPSHLQGLLQAAQPADVLPEHALIVGGEACSVALLEKVRALKPNCRLINHYGPTETTVGILTHEPGTVSAKQQTVAVGRPLANGCAKVLDHYLNGVPSDVAGELYLGGLGLAEGYLNQPGLTAERFVPSEQGARLYRSGDRARVSGDGLVSFIGRADEQVKIRGYRVEPSEVRQVLAGLDGVKEAAVIALALESDASRLQLVAYCSVAEHVSAQVLQQALQRLLPDYMIPAHFLLLERLPLTANGKLDKRALPAPGVLARGYVAPQGDVETTLAAVWADVLKLERVGSADNFFELGGDSILSLQIVARAKRQGIKLTPKQLFEKQTVGQLAQVAKVVEAKKSPVGAAPVEVSGMVPLLPIQARFFATDIPERHHWNQSVLLKPSERLHADHVQRALHGLVAHHDALRLRFVEQEGQWSAVFESQENVSLLWQRELLDIADLPALGEEAHASLALNTGPVLRAVLIELPDAEQRLLLTVHHLVVDGVSWRVLLEDLNSACQQIAGGHPVLLPGKTNSIKEWAERLWRYARSPAMHSEAYWWLEMLGQPTPELPRDNPQGSMSHRHAAYATTRLDAQQTHKLLKQAPAAYRTQINDLLLSALAQVLCQWSEQPSVLIQLEGHGREDLFEEIDLSRTVGWFTSLFPVRLTPAGDQCQSIKAVKQQLRNVPHKGIGYGLLRYLAEPEYAAQLQALPEPRVTFNYLGQFEGSASATSDLGSQQRTLLVPSAESTGHTRHRDGPLGNWLSINGRVYDGELQLEWVFSADVHAAHTIERLAGAYQDALVELIEHCTTEHAGGITPSDVPLADLTQPQLDSLPIAAQQVEDIYPLSPMQEGMLFHSLFERSAGHYVNQMRVDAAGLDVERFKTAWQAVVDRHEVLRANFLDIDGQQRQVIRKYLDLPVFAADWRDESQLQSKLDTWAQADRQKGFDLQRDPLLRLAIIRVAEDRHHLIYTQHHILLDGWSSSRLLGEVLQIYSGQKPGVQTARFRDYIEWLGRQDKQQCEAFWRAQFDTLMEPTLLARAIRRDQADLGNGYADHHQALDQPQTKALADFARQHRVTVNTLVQSAWLLLLKRYTGLDCVTFGATVSGRPADLKGIEQQLGLFINTLPVSANPRPEQCVGEWIEQVQRQNLALREFEHTPLYEVQRWAGAGEGLFDTLLVFENYPVSAALQMGAPQGLVFSGAYNQEQTHYPLTLAIGLGEVLSIRYGYDRASFSDASVRQIAAHLGTLLLALIGDARASVGELALLSMQENQQLIHDWNRTQAPYPDDQCIHQLIEAQVARTPDALAVVFADQQLTYRQLNQRSNQLAHKLRELGVGPDVLVGVALQRSLEMVVALLAILKAGGAYVPLDPEYPQERLAYMMEDSGIALLLIQAQLSAQFAGTQAIQTLVIAPHADELAAYGIENLANRTHTANLAYVIYTSGSTGRPKGAGNAHGALVNRLWWMQQAYRLSDTDVVLQKTPFSFDVSVWEFFWPLFTGARLAVAQPGAHRDPQQLVQTIRRHGVTTLHFVPSMLQVFMAHDQTHSCNTVRRTVCSGEALPAELSRQTLAQLPHAGLFNLYGPTEAAIDVTHWTCLAQPGSSVPIGIPIDNLQTYVVDTGLCSMMWGCTGELYLGGTGLARGYHGRAALTAERFIPDPFGKAGGGRLYRTGDLASYRADGVIEYAGRIDHQLKIRGLRIELGEIEACLQAHEQVGTAVVIDIDGDTGKQLAAYVVTAVESTQQPALRSRLRDHLKAHLPDYMVPTHWVFLAHLPLSPNGKLDRKQLPKPDINQEREVYIAPQGELERQIAAIWADVLQIERVGLADHFFDLGGHSLLATQATVRVRQLMPDVSIELREVFERPILADYVEQIRDRDAHKNPLQDDFAKSLEALKRLTTEEIDELIS